MKNIILTDIHFGAKGNSDEFNEQCIEFLKFVKEKTNELQQKNAEEFGCTIFMGDWFHNRNSINVKTLNYGIKGLQILSEIGNRHVKFLLGNHDLYYRDRRDIFSIPSIRTDDAYIHIIDKPYKDMDGNLYCPWLLSDEKLSDLIKKYNPTYVFGHFEIPTFSLNKLVKMEGEYNPQDYNGPKRILSGHFHMRQEKNNITYIGNCFSHDFSDSNDWKNKGFAVLDTETNEITYYEWKDAPKYCVTDISKMNTIDFNSNSNMYLQLNNDLNLKQDEVNQIKETLESLPNITQCLIVNHNTINYNTQSETIDTICNLSDFIVDLLLNIDMNNIDNTKLVKIYRDLIPDN